MSKTELSKKEIEALLPHREPMLLIDKLINIVHLKSATAIMYKLVYLMSVDKARFRNPVLPDCELCLEIEAIRSHGRVWKYKGTAKVDGKRMADAEWSATIVDRKE